MLAIIQCRICSLPVCYLKYEDWDTQNYNFACCVVWVWNLVTHIEGGTWAEGVWEQAAEENIRA